MIYYLSLTQLQEKKNQEERRKLPGLSGKGYYQIFSCLCVSSLTRLFAFLNIQGINTYFLPST